MLSSSRLALRSSATTSHAYGAAGAYSVTLTVIDSSGQSAVASAQVIVSAPAPHVAAVAGSGGGAGELSPAVATIDERTGTVTLSESLPGAGTLSWLLTFQNGRFGVFAASNSGCRTGFVRLKGRCRPARVVFAKGSRAVASSGVASFKIKPTSAGLAALRRALKQKRGVPVLVTLTFAAAGAGTPVTHVQSLLVRLKR